MALTVQLVAHGKVTDGHELRWRPFEAVIANSLSTFPTLARVDQWGEFRMSGDDLARAESELDALIPTTVPRRDLDELRRLIRRARAESADLIFEGD